MMFYGIIKKDFLLNRMQLTAIKNEQALTRIKHLNAALLS